jgi:hypothetical protein
VTALAVTVASGFAALATDAWTVALPRGVAADIRSSPDNGVLVTATTADMSAFATQSREVREVAAKAGPAGTFEVSPFIESATFDLTRVPSSNATADSTPPLQTFAVSMPAVAGSTELAQGSWPADPAPGGQAGGRAIVQVALPVPALKLAHLSVGQTFTLWDSITSDAVEFHVSGSFRYLDPSTAGGSWNAIGSSGVEYDGPFTILGPMVTTTGTFQSGALPLATGAWMITPNLTGPVDVNSLQADVTTLIDQSRPSYVMAFSSAWGFAIQTHLPRLLATLPARITAGRAELLAETLLLATLAAIAIAVSCGNLVGRGQAQAALLRSRGSPRRILVSGYLSDITVLLACSVLGAGLEDLYSRSHWGLTSSTSPPQAWVAAIAVGVASALVVLARAGLPPRAADVAAAAGRQLGAPAIVRAGLDAALVAVAGVTLWQAGHAGLTAGTTSGGTGAVLAVALAPAVVTLAGAAVCGRLVTTAARLSERAAERTGSLPVRLAAWELARTPLRYLVPALLCVASVAGCAYAAGQDASQVRSAHDQAAFSVGADASLTLFNTLPVGQTGSFTHQPGVIAATPEIVLGIGNSGALMALDTHTAAQTVALRADLAGGHPAQDWAAITPSAEPGIAVPGKPVSIGLRAALTAPGLGPVSPVLDVEDATGLNYLLPLSTLTPDGAPHTLMTSPSALGAGAAYPLRIVGVNLNYTLPRTEPASATLAITSLLEQDSAAGAPAAFPGAQQLSTQSWHVDATSTLQPFGPPCAVPADATENESMGAETDGQGPSTPTLPLAPIGADGAQITFNSGYGLNISWGWCNPVPVIGTVLLGVSQPGPLPVLATTSFLHDNDMHVGSVVSTTVDGMALSLVVKASVSTFPGLPTGTADAVVVDIGTLGADVNALGGQLPSDYVWLMHTADGNAPASVPPGTMATTAKQVAATMLADPLDRVPQRVIMVGAPVLVGLALLGLLVSLLAAARGAAARDVVLAALGTTRRQRAVLACSLYTAVVVPAVALGGLLGYALCTLLIPSFVLAADGTAPTPSALVLLAEPWTVFAAVLVLIAAVATALIASLRRGDPLALARTGG